MSSGFEVVQQSVLLLLPEWLILGVAVAMMTAGAFVRRPRHVWALAALAALAAALVALFGVQSVEIDPYSSVALNDSLAWYGRLVALLSGFVLLGLCANQVDDRRAPEFFGALLMILAGSMLVCAANELVFLFVGLELVSIPTYLLLYLPRRTEETQEAATKYFYLSIFSSALLLYGLAFLYGLAGVSNLKALSYLALYEPHMPQPQLGLIALVFVMAGLGFRVAAVPFHFYAPDVYQGSPTVLAALLAWIPKGIGFVAMLRVLAGVLGGDNAVSSKALILGWVIAAVSMTLGNAVALLQDNLKRLLAYSSIAHAGYLMIGITVAFHNDPVGTGNFLGGQGVLFYLAAYALMTLGAFGVIVALDSPEQPVENVDDLSGLGWSRPGYALALALCLFSLAGIPPMAGFWGKFYIFASALASSSDPELRMLRWLAIVGVLNAAVGAYYYLRIVMAMYLRPAPERPLAARGGWPVGLAVTACALLSLGLGLYPPALARTAREAAIAAVARPNPLLTAPAAVREAAAYGRSQPTPGAPAAPGTALPGR